MNDPVSCWHAASGFDWNAIKRRIKMAYALLAVCISIKEESEHTPAYVESGRAMLHFGTCFFSQEGLEGPCLNSLKGDAEKREIKKRKKEKR
jgi:hypothetical protein